MIQRFLPHLEARSVVDNGVNLSAIEECLNVISGVLGYKKIFGMPNYSQLGRLKIKASNLPCGLWVLAGQSLKENPWLPCGVTAVALASATFIVVNINFNGLNHEVSEHIATLAGGFLKVSIACGSLGRNFAQLCRSITLGKKETAAKVLQESKSPIAEPKWAKEIFVHSSRVYQALTDICEASGDSHPASDAWVWDVVAEETSAAVGQSHIEEEVNCDFGRKGKEECGASSSSGAKEESAVSNSTGEREESATSRSLGEKGESPAARGKGVIRSRIELPVRLDIVGGWSDTPPWSLERIGCVLNMAVQLDGQYPLCAKVLLRV